MSDTLATLLIRIEDWHTYQERLSAALAPLSAEQLALRAAPHLRSVGELACHIISVRAGWFHNILGEGDEAFGAYHEWDTPGAPVRSADELAQGLAATWQVMRSAIARFTPDDLDEVVAGERKGHMFHHRRGWVLWHVLEHDLHHGGEIGYSLGIHGLTAPDI